MLTVITPPTNEPLSLIEAKRYLRVTHDFEDLEIAQQIIAARRWIESHCWRTLPATVLELSLDRFPSDRVIYLPRPRFASLVSITYIDPTGAAVVLAAERIEADTTHEPGRVRIDAAGWPATADRLAAVRIRYQAGGGEIPAELVLCMKLLLGSWYDNRHAAAGWDDKVRKAAERMLAGYRVIVNNHLPYLLGTSGDLEAAGL